METDLLVRDAFYFDRDRKIPSGQSLVDGRFCIICNSARRVVAAGEIGDRPSSAHGIGIHSIEDDETASSPALFNSWVSLLETLNTGHENRLGHPAPLARPQVTGARSCNDDRKRQRSLLQA
ncbi:MAG: hypothetical protein ACREEJ_11925 [Ensifer adhaerens]